MLSLKNVTARVGRKTILHNVSVAFARGKTYAIMGPNGSGKSTLARVIMGDPTFRLTRDSRITYGRGARAIRLDRLSSDKRARHGIFLSAQTPPTIDGVTVRDVLRTAAVNEERSALDVSRAISHYARELAINDDLLARPLNAGASGGERKKLEVLQMAILNPQYIILDEIDTGVDVDALKTIGTFLTAYVADTRKTLIIITHATRILRYLTPDVTLVLRNGRIAQRGDATLAAAIERDGFSQEDH